MLSILLLAPLIFAALIGMSVALYIEQKKSRHEALVCPIGYDCNAVISSEYSSFLGIPLERLGLFYYTIIVLGYAAYFILPELPLSALLFPLTLGALLFSIYLTFIQAFTLKDWCTWCLTSAVMSTIIFISSTFMTDFASLFTIVDTIKPGLIIIHLLGVVFGLGGATIGDLFFFKFLADHRISKYESDTLRTISQVIWFGLGLLVVSGVGLVLTDPLVYLTSAKFLAKMVVVSVIIINGAFLNLYIAPLLIRMAFDNKSPNREGALHHERSLAFASGAISFISWYTAFILGFLDRLPLSLWPTLVLYFSCLIVGIAVSQIVENRIARRAPRPTPGSSHNQNTEGGTSNLAAPK